MIKKLIVLVLSFSILSLSVSAKTSNSKFFNNEQGVKSVSKFSEDNEVNTVNWIGNPNDPGAQYTCRDVSKYW